MDTPTEPARRARIAWAIVAGATVAAAGAYYALATLGRPYHQDTILYIENIRGLLRDGAPTAWFPSRIGTTWAYLPGYALLGEAGLRWTNVAGLVATLALYLAVVRRDFGRTEAWASAVTFATAPAVILTVTHLKEDVNALLFLAAALAVAGPGTRPPRAAAAGALAGVALLCKEFPLLFAPFLAGHVWLAAAGPAAEGDLARGAAARTAGRAALAFLGAALLTVLALSPRHFLAMAALRQGGTPLLFTGTAAGVEAAWAAWREGALHAAALPVLAIGAIAAGGVRREGRTALWGISAIAVALALGLNTGTRGRVFGPALFLVLPPAWRGVRAALAAAARRAGPATAPRLASAATATLALGLAAWHLADLAPTLAYRDAYPPQAVYFEGLRAALPADAVLYGMDSCTHAAYFTGRPCRGGPVDPDAPAARAWVDALLEEARRRPALLLQDFEAYDAAGTLGAELRARARLVPAYWGLGEDFHAMSYAVPAEADAARWERLAPECRRARFESGPLPGMPDGGFALGRTVFRCGAEERVRAYVAYRGHVTDLAQLNVLRVVPLGEARP